MAKSYLVTGGTGFIGSAIVKKLVHKGHSVTVLDNNSRGNASRINDVLSDIKYVEGDVRDFDTVKAAMKGTDSVLHLAYVNGTEFFYQKPEFILEIAIKGMMNVLDAAIFHEVRDFHLASSSEVYQTPPVVPTPEDVPLIVPDIRNPRYSYGGGKIACELLAVNYGRKYFDRMCTFRPHNVYGPDMGFEHVIPQLVLRAAKVCDENPQGTIEFPIQGTGQETRAFVHIDDFTEGLYRITEAGGHLETYHIGNSEEVTIRELVGFIFEKFNRSYQIKSGELMAGSTLRRCPDITKLKTLGYSPKIPLREGIESILNWYKNHYHSNKGIKK